MNYELAISPAHQLLEAEVHKISHVTILVTLVGSIDSQVSGRIERLFSMSPSADLWCQSCGLDRSSKNRTIQKKEHLVS